MLSYPVHQNKCLAYSSPDNVPISQMGKKWALVCLKVTMSLTEGVHVPVFMCEEKEPKQLAHLPDPLPTAPHEKKEGTGPVSLRAC